MRMLVSGTRLPRAARLTMRKSPTNKVFSIEPDVMTKVWIRKLRSTRKRTTAMAMDLIHSTSPPPGFAPSSDPFSPALVWGARSPTARRFCLLLLVFRPILLSVLLPCRIEHPATLCRLA